MAKKEVVKDIFDDIAPKYDLLNHLLSLNIDKGWRKKAMKHIGEKQKGRLFGRCVWNGRFFHSRLSFGCGPGDGNRHFRQYGGGWTEKSPGVGIERSY